MTPQLPFDTEVLIVGAGPVGLGLAIELGQRGIRCIVVERQVQPQLIPKGQNLTQRTLEHFYFWGTEPALRAARTIPRGYGIGGITAYGNLLSGHAYDWLQRELVRPFYFTDNERLPQYATETVLRDRVSQIETIETLFGYTADEISQEASGTHAVVSKPGSSGHRTLRALYTVGCDGSRSIVRESARITQTRSDHDKLMVLLVFRSEELHQLLERFPKKSFYNVLHPDLQGYWQFFGRVDLGTTWFFHAPVPLGTTKDNFDFAAYVQKATGAAFHLEILHLGFWDLRFATADQYRESRIFIAGDAAHSHPPYGGYGINTGLEDAVNLGWKLAAAIRGWAGSRLLDSYGEERRAVFASTAKDFIEKSIRTDKEFVQQFDPARDPVAFEQEWQSRQSTARSEVSTFEPNYQGSSIVCGPPGSTCGAVGTHERAARAGHHLTPRALSSGPNIFEELGKEFTLVDFGTTDDGVQRLQRAADARAVPIKIIKDPNPEARDFFQAALLIVRPDQFVAWADHELPADCDALLAQLVGAAD